MEREFADLLDKTIINFDMFYIRQSSNNEKNDRGKYVRYYNPFVKSRVDKDELKRRIFLRNNLDQEKKMEKHNPHSYISSGNRFNLSLNNPCDHYSDENNVLKDTIIKIEEKIKEKYNCDVVVNTGMFWYPPGGSCDWHTNSDGPGKRVYLTWAKEEGKSFFRYYDSKKDDIVTKYDKKGWSINEFEIFNEEYNLYWHCVDSNTVRISYGYLLVYNK